MDVAADTIDAALKTSFRSGSRDGSSHLLSFADIERFVRECRSLKGPEVSSTWDVPDIQEEEIPRVQGLVNKFRDESDQVDPGSLKYWYQIVGEEIARGKTQLKSLTHATPIDKPVDKEQLRTRLDALHSTWQEFRASHREAPHTASKGQDSPMASEGETQHTATEESRRHRQTY